VDGVPVDQLTRRLVEAGIAVHEAVPERLSLEALVLGLTGPGSDRVPGGASPRDNPDGSR
jgi:hypothetical protein